MTSSLAKQYNSLKAILSITFFSHIKSISRYYPLYFLKNLFTYLCIHCYHPGPSCHLLPKTQWLSYFSPLTTFPYFNCASYNFRAIFLKCQSDQIEGNISSYDLQGFVILASNAA
jgi:hypothetical protein